MFDELTATIVQNIHELHAENDKLRADLARMNTLYMQEKEKREAVTNLLYDFMGPNKS